MAIRIKDNTNLLQTIPNAKEVAQKIDLKILDSLRDLGLDNYSGEPIPGLLSALSQAVAVKADKDFAGETGTVVKDFNLRQDSVLNKVIITGNLVSPSTKAITPFEFTFDVGGNQEDLQGEVTELSGKVDVLEKKVPTLADKDFVNSSIQQMAADRVTYNISGDPFPTRASLLSATVFYRGGKAYVPNGHDYALIVSDEGAPAPFTKGQTRFEYEGSSWVYAYGINDRPFTSEERSAIESGITLTKVEEFSFKYTKPVTGIPKTDLADSVKTSLQKADTALQEAPVYTKTDIGLDKVDNTSDAGKPISNAAQIALALKQDKTDNRLSTTDKTISGAINELMVLIQAVSGGGESMVLSVNGKTGIVSLVKEDLGLGNVDNVRQYSEENPTILTSSMIVKAGADLNDVLVTGFYSVSESSVSATLINCPTRAAFNLQVTGDLSGTERTQTLTEFSIANPKKFYRNYYKTGYIGDFSPWYRIYSESDKPTPTEIGAATSSQGAKADTAIQTETDPTVSTWAKAATKPSYTKDEVGLGNVDNTSDQDKPVSTEVQEALNTKVDKAEGKVLSTNDYTTAEKNKLISVEEGAQVNLLESIKINNTPINVIDKVANITIVDDIAFTKNLVAADWVADGKYFKHTIPSSTHGKGSEGTARCKSKGLILMPSYNDPNLNDITFYSTQNIPVTIEVKL